MKYYSVMNPPVYDGRDFSQVENKLEDCECPSIRQILHRHVAGMPSLLNRYEDYDENEPIIGNGIDEFDLMDAHIARQMQLGEVRASQAQRRAKQKSDVGATPPAEGEPSSAETE